MPLNKVDVDDWIKKMNNEQRNNSGSIGAYLTRYSLIHLKFFNKIEKWFELLNAYLYASSNNISKY